MLPVDPKALLVSLWVENFLFRKTQSILWAKREIFFLSHEQLFADALVVYRCYSLFGSSHAEYYLALPALMVLWSGVDGFSVQRAMQLRPAFFAMSLVTNLTVTSLAAGRLYCLSRNQEWHILFIEEPELLRRYRRSFAIMQVDLHDLRVLSLIKRYRRIESGGLYSLTLGLFLVLCIGQDPSEGAALIVQSALAQIMGIVPTSIIVIVGLGMEFSRKGDTGRIKPSPYKKLSTSPFSRLNRSHQKRELESSSVMNIV
ncbi:hypothetical protein BDP27DRAFT_1457588 [Rhodocollybia butyracea]|uniref:Uncharacterized protein n=1 Tax=Rhodocollybia butyracea TaxID=206335 RepID=A0A9P5P5L8_9AGAR|nr:hypothetical protein BDP27DRAFT_1457588 [Rhodocollybia butyracea]